MLFNTDLKAKPTAKSIYIWNITGSLSNALASVLYLMLVTRTIGAAEGDVFSLAFAISQLMLTVGTFQVRLYQSTDVKEIYSFRQYLVFRFITIFIMNISAVFYVVIKGYDNYKIAVIFLLVCFRTFDSLADVYDGWFQQKERLDLSGKGLALKVILSLLAFGLLLMVTHNLLIGCAGMFAAYVIGFFMFEYRYSKVVFAKPPKLSKTEFRSMFSLFVKCMPLFLNAFLITSIYNSPKMAIDTNITNGLMREGDQTIYGILFMPAAVINLAFILFRPMITQMAIFYHSHDLASFKKTVRQIALYLAGFTVVIMAGGWLLGIPVLSVIYPLNLKGCTLALMILLAGGTVNAYINVLDNALTVIRKQHILMVMYVITWVFSMCVTPFLVHKLGLTGASLSFLTSMALLLTGTFILYRYYMNQLGHSHTEK